MSRLFHFLFFCFSLFTSMAAADPETFPSLYLSSSIFSKNYENMESNFRIFVYVPSKAFSFSTRTESLFYNSLLQSPFLTHNPEDAHLFFIPFPSDLSARSISRLIRELRVHLPYWNRTLGADHFFLSSAGFASSSDRNVVELKKNSIQLSSFPSSPGKFVPHKDVTLPPVINSDGAVPPVTGRTERILGYVRHGWVRDLSLFKQLADDPDFLSESEPSNWTTYVHRLANSDFCLFEYDGDVSVIGQVLSFGCVPVVISNRPIQDLPFMDVLRWPEIAIFVGSGGGIHGVKRVLRRVDEERLVQMRRLAAAAAQYFAWNSPSQPLDSFNTVMYQLWLRRHAIRYADRREWAQA